MEPSRPPKDSRRSFPPLRASSAACWEIVEINHDPRAAAVWLNTRIQISGIAGVNTNNISVFTHLADNGIMHVALVVKPDHDPEGDTAIWTAIEDLRLP